MQSRQRYEHALLRARDGKVEFWLNSGAGKFCIIFLSEKQAEEGSLGED